MKNPVNGSLRVVVVGGGAAGFFGAIVCAEANPGARVTILEKGEGVLRKVLLSGGGRCNVTHACFEPRTLVGHYPRGSRELLGAFQRFQPRDTMAWFESRGVELKTEEDGRVFPVSDRSGSIVDALLNAAQAAGVAVRTGAGPRTVERSEPSGFRVVLEGGEGLHADRLLLATGSGRQGYAWARRLGHSLVPPVPSLFTFSISDKRLEGLAGVAVENAVLFLEDTPLSQSGPLLITHGGLSGPAVLKLSAWGARELSDRGYVAKLRINWAGISSEEVQARFQEMRIIAGPKTVGGRSPVGIPQRLWERLVQFAGVGRERRWADLTTVERGRLMEELTGGIFEISGKGAFKEEFVTAGGVPLNEVNFKTMESRRSPGLFFAGEILDIDGVTGGFNFQSAWTTGWQAGRAMAKEP